MATTDTLSDTARDVQERMAPQIEDARRELAARWGYPTTPGDVKLDIRHDRVVGRVTAGGKPVLECELLDRDTIAGGDIQYIASMHLARNKEDGKLVLVQVDPEFVFHKAERGKPTWRWRRFGTSAIPKSRQCRERQKSRPERPRPRLPGSHRAKEVTCCDVHGTVEIKIRWVRRERHRTRSIGARRDSGRTSSCARIIPYKT